MKTYKVELTKTYKIEIKAESENEARYYAEFFTGNIENISTKNDEQKYNFQIRDIECVINESNQVVLLNETS